MFLRLYKWSIYLLGTENLLRMQINSKLSKVDMQIYIVEWWITNDFITFRCLGQLCTPEVQYSTTYQYNNIVFCISIFQLILEYEIYLLWCVGSESKAATQISCCIRCKSHQGQQSERCTCSLCPAWGTCCKIGMDSFHCIVHVHNVVCVSVLQA